MTSDGRPTADARRRPAVGRGPSALRSRPALPWLLCQVVLALVIHQLRRPMRRPTGTEVLLWLGLALVATGFLALLVRLNTWLAGAVALGLLLFAWREWH